MSRRRIWLRRALFFALVLALLYAGARVAIDVVATKRLETAIARVRASGATLVPGDAAPPPVPDEENAAVLLEEAFTLLVDDPVETYAVWDVLQDSPHALSSEDVHLFEAWLEQNERGLALVAKALERSRCLFHHDWDHGWDSDATHVPGLQLACRALSVRAYLAVRARDVDGALAASRTILQLGRACRRQDTALDLLVGAGIEWVGHRLLNEALAVGPASAPTLRLLLADLDAATADAPLDAVFTFERAVGHLMFVCYPDEALRQVGIDTAPDERSLGLRVATTLFDAPALRLDHARFLERMEEVLALAKRPFAAARDAWDALTEVAESPPWYDRIGGAVLVVYPVVARQWAGYRARADLARIALRIELYDLAEGHLPASLDVLDVPGGVRDRLGDGPYRYRPEATGAFLLYSVSLDGKDDGGRETENPLDEGDLVWRRPARGS